MIHVGMLLSDIEDMIGQEKGVFVLRDDSEMWHQKGDDSCTQFPPASWESKVYTIHKQASNKEREPYDVVYLQFIKTPWEKKFRVDYMVHIVNARYPYTRASIIPPKNETRKQEETVKERFNLHELR